MAMALPRGRRIIEWLPTCCATSAVSVSKTGMSVQCGYRMDSLVWCSLGCECCQHDHGSAVRFSNVQWCVVKHQLGVFPKWLWKGSVGIEWIHERGATWAVSVANVTMEVLCRVRMACGVVCSVSCECLLCCIRCGCVFGSYLQL